MRAVDNNAASNISATTTGFQLRGGKYAIFINATFGGGNVVLQRLHNDATTWIPCHTAITALTTSGPTVVDLPLGQYRWAVTTATAVYATVDRVPND